MKLPFGMKFKYSREIEKHRKLFAKKNLKYVRDNWIFYWLFLANLEDTGYRPMTVERYYYQLKGFLEWLGNKSVRRVKKKDIEQYLTYFKNERCHHPYTIRYIKEAIGVFFSFVMRFSRIKVNPTAGLGIRIHYPQPENMDYFTQQEVMMIVRKPLQVLKRAKRSDFRTEYYYRRAIYSINMHYLILKLMFSTGIRPCEVANIEISDFKVDELKLRIRTKGNQQYIVKDRNVFITEKTAKELKEFITLKETIRNIEEEQKLFHHYSGWSIRSGYINRVVKYWANLCGIKRIVYAYMIRYTYCTRLVENGVDLYSLKKLMGHKQTAITLKHYLKLTPSELRKEWKMFNPLKKGATL